MKKQRVYLDNCCFNRPYDDQEQEKIILETEAKLKIQSMIKNEQLDLVWSYILDYENSENPDKTISRAISEWKQYSYIDTEEDAELINLAESIKILGLDSKDALHIACAITGKADYFFTTDKKVLKKGAKIKEIKILNPVKYFIEDFMEDKND
ncbi:MAG: hypothetical protein A2Y33_02465 [Spirochaetes bacterium GWF1_51_8]|nr:MAG: hypothetical protein A2Y33_02465 [Spirochaetes bacterium GWF1_51_8]